MPTTRRALLGALGLGTVGTVGYTATAPHQVRQALDLPTATISRDIDQPPDSVRVVEFTVPDGLVTLTLDVTGGQPAAWIADPPDDAKVGRGLDADLGIVVTPDTPSTTDEIAAGDYALVVEASGDSDATGTVSLAHY